MPAAAAAGSPVPKETLSRHLGAPTRDLLQAWLLKTGIRQHNDPGKATHASNSSCSHLSKSCQYPAG